ncbi:hypothetical protein [Stenotrophomonas sp. KCTC 12332]|uniref:hypothetical protein n=1 Tax=Stenotrophomonas sp. KCTC 12332 TaxID=1793721 RepID=UPI000AAC99E7|nr:hypothetical protein [Stenotrophomonas sp. KCTC 12332]
MFLYHCTDSENLCKIALDDFTKDNVIRGLCFSDNALDHFGDVTYRIELRDEENMLTTDMLHNLDVSPTNSIDYMSDRHGNPLIIRGKILDLLSRKPALNSITIKNSGRTCGHARLSLTTVVATMSLLNMPMEKIQPGICRAYAAEPPIILVWPEL